MRSDNMPRPFAPLHDMEAKLLDIVVRLRYMASDGDHLGVSELTVDTAHLREAAEEIERLRSQIAGLLDQHARDSKELRSLCQQRDEARRSAGYWKVEHRAANVEIERLRNEIGELHMAVKQRDQYAAEKAAQAADALSELSDLRAKIEAAPVERLQWDWYDEIVCFAPNFKPDWSYLLPLVGKRVRMVVEEG